MGGSQSAVAHPMRPTARPKTRQRPSSKTLQSLFAIRHSSFLVASQIPPSLRRSASRFAPNGGHETPNDQLGSYNPRRDARDRTRPWVPALAAGSRNRKGTKIKKQKKLQIGPKKTALALPKTQLWLASCSTANTESTGKDKART
jgi:hypothetical protein